MKNIQIQKRIELTEFADQLGSDKHSTQRDSVSAKPKEEFTILESIDEGAMGEILIAMDNELGRTVAYKKSMTM